MTESNAMSVFVRIREGLARTTQQLVEPLRGDRRARRRAGRPLASVDVDTIEALEELLISADVGVPATGRIVEAVRRRERQR